jgi:ferredoxin
LEILEKICAGKGQPGDIEALEDLCFEVTKNSLCGLGQGAPNPVISMLKHFRAEYEAHIYEKKCPAKVCKALIRFEIQAPTCTGCTVCARNCPVEAITGERRQAHLIDVDKCVRCGICVQVCNFNAIKVL